MKKFLMFLVVTIVTVCIGMTFYQFAKNDEVITVNTQTIYINYGDKLSLDDIGFSRKEASKDTKIDFNAGGDEVTSIIKFDEATQCYIPTPKGGSTTIKISTSNYKYKSFTIDVIVGIGTEEYPYYISNEAQLFDIGYKYALDAHFELVNDINVKQMHDPIGLVDGKYNEFAGSFNGNYHTISNLKVNKCDFGGLFGIIGSNSSVYNLNVDNAVIEGSYLRAGAVAGICYGTINKVVVSNATITNTQFWGYTGAVVGALQTDSTNGVTASILRTYAYTDQEKVITANSDMGGLAGYMNSAIIHACHTDLQLVNTSHTSAGGLVGMLYIDPNTYIRESYSISQIHASGAVGNLIGQTELASGVKLYEITKELVFVGLYYDNSLNTFKGIGSDDNNISTATRFAVNGRSPSELKTKSTYIYYVNHANNIVYWDKVWHIVDGEYPTLTSATMFDDVVIGGDNTSTSTPDITNPSTPSVDAIIISTKQQLINAFQSSSSVNGNYILNANIDLQGTTWTPVSFSGTFKSSEGKCYTISNFIINTSKLYAGFFYTLSSANISNIKFENVFIEKNGLNETAGILVGYVCGNTTIENVNVEEALISAHAKYAGAIAGYIGNTITELNNCQVKNLVINNALNIGGIAGYSAENVFISNCNLLNENNLISVDRIGGIVGVNHGKIDNCYIYGNINSSSTASAAGYFGGLCGVNYGLVTDSISYAKINVTNTAPASSSIYYFVGGLCGYNIGSFVSCCAYANEYAGNPSSSITYIGGLTGYNKGNLSYCLANVLNVGAVKSNIIVAGLTVYNYGGNIFGCASMCNLSGYQVAGLVRSNGNNGIITSCMASMDMNSRATYKGAQVAGLAYEISSGTINNCLVNANLSSLSTDGWVAGFAGFMPCIDDKYGSISYCIANVSFDGSTTANKYLDIAQDGLMKKRRTTGTIAHCVINEEAKTDDVIISEYSKFLWITYDAGSNSNYIVTNNNAIKDINTYLDPDKCDFDIKSGNGTSVWLYSTEFSTPIPRAISVVFEF